MTGITTRFASLALAAAIAVSLAGCAESTQSKTCAQADKVRSSIDDLRDVNLSENGIAALRSAVTQVSTELDMLRTTLGADAQSKVAGVQSAIGQLRTTVSTAVADPTPANINEVGVARNAARSAVHDLATAVTSGC
jgi:hypothetical protein